MKPDFKKIKIFEDNNPQLKIIANVVYDSAEGIPIKNFYTYEDIG